MNIDTANQLYLFVIFIINGILIGIVFDIFRILRKSFKTPNFITDIEDILFWIITALIIMISAFVYNNGEFRAYMFIGIFIRNCNIYVIHKQTFYKSVCVFYFNNKKNLAVFPKNSFLSF